ncbi:hypothetical protein [Haladaptatus sp. CMAA 1911]|uniref:hypothetical protein n=1 Tax=unclassified Haladaptatus TaxID=2622732 RepID=UPI0037550200
MAGVAPHCDFNATLRPPATEGSGTRLGVVERVNWIVSCGLSDDIAEFAVRVSFSSEDVP